MLVRTENGKTSMSTSGGSASAVLNSELTPTFQIRGRGGYYDAPIYLSGKVICDTKSGVQS